MSNTDSIVVEKQNKISRRIKCFFYIMHFFLGLDLGYFKRTTNKTKIFLYMYSFVHSICLCANVFIYVFYESDDDFINYWIVTLLCQHIFNTMVLSFSDEKSSFHNLQNSLICLDSKLCISDQIKMDNKIILSCLFSVAYRTLATYLFCTRNKDECVISVVGASIAYFQLLASDSLLIISFFIFYTIYLRLQVFVKFVKNNDSQIIDSLQIYKSIVDMVDTVKRIFDVLYTVALIVATPNLIITSYMGLTKLKDQSYERDEDLISDNLVRVMYCIQDFGLLIIPAISAGLLTSGVNELKVTLYDRLLHERYEAHASTIEVFLSYAEARPLRLTVCRLVRLDWSLPVLVLNLCVTYQIVVVQLTHLY